MTRPRARIGLVLVAVLLAAACTEGGEAPRTSRDGSPSTAAAPGDPYPFATPAPAEEPSPVDGTYTRRTSIRQAGGVPVFCQRCAPYRVNAGTSTLTLDRGRFYIAFETISMESPCPDCRKPPGFKSSGHFTVSGDEIVFFNDPNCTDTPGTYGWTLSDGMLVFDLVRDPCPFVHLRARYLTSAPWHEGTTG